MDAPKLLTPECAERLEKLKAEDVSAIIKLASLGMKAQQICDYVLAVDSGESPAIPVAQGSVKTHTVQAYSLLSDPAQYHGMYGMPTALAAEMKERLLSDPNSVKGELSEIVRKALELRGSPRPVSVTLDGIPSGRRDAASGSPRDDGGAAQLAALISKNSGVYGAYTFKAQPTGEPGADAFRVLLGGNLAVHARNTKAAIAAARLVRVHGRTYPPVIEYTRTYAEGRTAKPPGSIPASIWDGKLPFGKEAPPNENGNGSTSVGSPKK